MRGKVRVLKAGKKRNPDSADSEEVHDLSVTVTDGDHCHLKQGRLTSTCFKVRSAGRIAIGCPNGILECLWRKLMRLSVLALAACFTALPLTLPAQAVVDLPPAKWSLSLGVDPTHFDLRTKDPGVDARFAATGARLWQLRNPALTTHVALMLGLDAPRGLPETEISPELDVSRYYAALTAGGSYEMSQASRVRPYVTGGGGGYFNDVGWKIACTGATCDPRLAKYQQNFRETTFGVNGGLGVNVSFGKKVLFIEQRFHGFDVTRLDNGVHPFSVGMRF